MEWWHYYFLALGVIFICVLAFAFFKKEKPESEKIQAKRAEIKKLASQLKRRWTLIKDHGEMGASYGFEDLEGYEQHNRKINSKISQIEYEIEEIKKHEKAQKKR